MPGVDTDHCTLIPRDQIFKFERIEEEDVQRLLASLDVSKAPGLDGISSRVLKMVAPAISLSLTSLFNFSLLRGQMATEWKFARVTPVPKRSGSVHVEDFRPVSVLPVVAKIIERLVYRQLFAFLQKHSILHKAQSGFRPHHTTQDVLVSTTDDWRKALDEDKLVGTVMIDLSKAFDMVSHSIFFTRILRAME